MPHLTMPERNSTIVPPEDAGGICPMFAKEEPLLEALRRDDPSAFTGVVEKYSASMLRLARNLVRTRAAAEDAVQETWAALLAGIGRFQGRSSLKTWLFRVLYKRCLTRRNQERRSVPFSALRMSDHGGDFAAALVDRRSSGSETPDRRILASELRERIESAIDGLPGAQRDVITLRDVEGRPSDEVCRLLCLSECNQRVILHRARVRLRAALRAAATA